MSIWAALGGGFVGTLVLTTALAAGSQLRLTRIDIPFLLGTSFTEDRSRAKIFGYAAHFVMGLIFALFYYAGFVVLGLAGWLLGAVFGFIHALFAGTTLVNVLLPAVHPRMGTPWTDAEETPLLEAPGFLLANYGRRTVIWTLFGHIVFGAIVGGFAAQLS